MSFNPSGSFSRSITAVFTLVLLGRGLPPGFFLEVASHTTSVSGFWYEGSSTNAILDFFALNKVIEWRWRGTSSRVTKRRKSTLHFSQSGFLAFYRRCLQAVSWFCEITACCIIIQLSFFHICDSLQEWEYIAIKYATYCIYYIPSQNEENVKDFIYFINNNLLRIKFLLFVIKCIHTCVLSDCSFSELTMTRFFTVISNVSLKMWWLL